MNNQIKIRKAPIEQKPVLEKLMQLYLHDFSEYDKNDVNPDGLYEYKYLDSYWTENDRHPFLIYHENQFAGFVLVNSHVILEENKGAKSIAEFFILRKYRRKGIGSSAASSVFDMFPGKWEVALEKENKPSHEFWRKVISDYTEGKFSEIIPSDETLHGPIQSFDNS
ncbi:MAG: GNAT family N-acetyltransferase [bacterium]